MGDNEKKWTHELEVLTQALSLAREKGGEARRNVDRLTGKYDSKRERPDIAIEKNDGSVIGLEHFRVDKLARKDKKVRSAAKEYEGDLERTRKNLLPEMQKPQPSDEAVGTFGEVIYRGMRLYMHSEPKDLLRSLNARLNGDSGHARKLTAYRDNIARDYPHSSSIELGYLIEMHADFVGMFLNEGGRVTRLSSGQVPLFDGLYDMLKQASHDVDWIVIASYGSISSSITDAAVIRCKDGMFRTSCKRQGLSRTAILDSGAVSGLDDMGKHFTPEFERSDDKIAFEIEKAFRVSNPNLYFERTKELAARAVECDNSGTPFLASTGVQMIFELVRDKLPRKCAGPISLGTIEKTLRSIPREELSVRLDSFGKRWSLEGDDRFMLTLSEMIQG